MSDPRGPVPARTIRLEFEFDGTAWPFVARIQPSDRAVGDQFGISMARQDDLLAIGAFKDDDQGKAPGAHPLRCPEKGRSWRCHVAPPDNAPASAGAGLYGGRIDSASPSRHSLTIKG